MRRRIGFLAALIVSLAACGGGSGSSSGLNYGQPTVEVSGLEQGEQVTVTLEGAQSEQLSFAADGSRRFTTRVQDDKSYTLSLAATGTVCTFGNGRNAIVSKNASQAHAVGCGREVVAPPPDPDPNDPDPADPADPQARSLQVSLGGVGSAENPIRDGQHATVQVTLRGAGGQLLAGEVVHFSTTLGELSVDSALTTSAGVATVILSAGDTKGAGSLTVTHHYLQGEDEHVARHTVNFATEGDAAGAPPVQSDDYVLSLQLFDAAGALLGPAEAIVTVNAPLTLRATLTHNGAPVPGAIVRFNTAVGEIEHSSRLTNAAGVATTTLTAGATAAAGTVNATVTIGQTTVSGSINAESLGGQQPGSGTAAVVVALALLDSTNNPVGTAANPITQDRPATVIATVTLDGQPLANEVLEFTSPNYGELSPTSALTDAAGRAQVQLRAGEQEGAGTLAAAVMYQGQPYTGSVNFLTRGASHEDGETMTLTLKLDGESAPYALNPLTSNSPGVVEVELTRGDTAIPVPGQLITLASDIGQLEVDRVLTDGNGRASTRIAVGENDPSGAGTLTATFTLGGEQHEVTLNFALVNTSVDRKPELTLTLSNIQIDKDNPALVQATVTQDGAPVAGVVVEFSTDAGVLSPTSGRALTDAAGVATLNLLAGEVQTAGTITARLFGVADVEDTATFNTKGDGGVVQNPEAGWDIEFALRDQSNTADITEIGGNDIGLLVVRLVDDQGNGVAGQIINLSVTAGNLAPASGLVLTGADGRAQATLASGGVPGAGTATATFGSLEKSVNFMLTGEEPVVGNIAMTAPAEINASAPAMIVAQVTDASGQPVANQIVTFTTELGTMTPASGRVATDNTGNARIELDVGEAEGAGVLTATTEFDSQPVSTRHVFTAVQDFQLALVVTYSDPTASVVTSEHPATIVAILQGANGPVEGKVVTFAATVGELAGTSGRTNASGEVEMTLVAGTVPGDGEVIATLTDNAAVNARAAVKTLGGASLFTFEIISIRNSGGDVTTGNPIRGGDPARVRVSVVHPDTDKVADQLVTLETTLGEFQGPVSSGTTATIATDSSGEAWVELASTGVSGGGIVTASFPAAGLTDTAVFTIRESGVNDVYLEALRVYDNNNVETRIVPADGFLTVEARVVDGAGIPIQNRVVAFALDAPAGVGGLDPVNGTALTDGNGVATVKLMSGAERGAGIVTATVRIGWEGEEQSSSQSASFSSEGGGVEATPEPVEIAFEFDAAVDPGPGLPLALSEGRSLLVSVAFTSNGAPWMGEGYVEFNSHCLQTGHATLVPDAPVPNLGGYARATYTPGTGCVVDTLYARAQIGAELLVAERAVEVSAAPAQAIEFIGATPAALGLQGSSHAGAVETGQLSFIVRNAAGNPVAAGTEVRFSTVNDIGGFEITSDPVSQTDQNGQVVVTVRSGSVPMVAGVRAELLADASIFATGQIPIHSGVVTQNRFSLATEQINVLAGDHQGVSVPVTIRAADRFGNWLDGVDVNFTTELGDIDGSCETTNGTCTVMWTSHGAQPIHFDEGRATRGCSSINAFEQGVLNPVRCDAFDRYGRSTVTAWTIGEESFIDQNGNNLFDEGEQWTRLPEAFRDDNETGFHEREPLFSEEYMDFDQDGGYTEVDPAAPFRGVGCADTDPASPHCKALTHVRRSALIVLATDNVQGWVVAPGSSYTGWGDISDSNTPPQGWGRTTLTGLVPVVSLPPEGGDFRVIMADMNGNAPAAGSSISVEVTDSSARILGEPSCQAASRTEPLVCDFSVKPSSGQTAIEPGTDILVTLQSAAAIGPVLLPAIPVQN
ncbi:hypothetical protein [Alcanivorax quisquiliarum]|uniref:Big-1 domain-containing protein n=1 Tax=Alcanivorax quisquiliarum TaxID=2933565 RepID=A0ABT0E5R9_9GAMM|nr:hypothetical protein [Alcanivorax quisquiliarum]MCK0536997.1 hypothetical protein [Alcanivorax quisquiliarum]